MKNHVLILVMLSFIIVEKGKRNDRTVWYVHPDSTLNTIQAALDSCLDNDIVLVGPGTYYENIAWPSTQGIHLISEHGYDSTIIDGNNISSVILIDIEMDLDSTTIIKGFTIQHGNSPGFGGGIFCDWDASPYICFNKIIDNRALWWGGGIATRRASPIIKNNHVENNISGTGSGPIGCGGGISFFRSFGVISYNTIINNDALDYYGGGIICSHSAPKITHNTITGNTAAYCGGGIHCTNSGPIIDSNTISQNSANAKGGGICLYEDSATVITRNLISFNYSIFTGGGIGLERLCSPLIRKNTIVNNAAPYGAGIYCVADCFPVVDSCTIAYNDGDGVYCWATSSPELHYNDIIQNTGYGVYNNDPTYTIDAEYNWWGDPSGPGGVGPGTGDEVSDYVDYDPWLGEPGVEVKRLVVVKSQYQGATVFSGPLLLPEGKKCRVFDITGRTVVPERIKPGIYFIEVDGVITQKIVKIR